jgi:hypothetical protein
MFSSIEVGLVLEPLDQRLSFSRSSSCFYGGLLLTHKRY